ncbi:MAG: PhnD/SsuA/transferrin family substrate-binding protein, partial [Deltaproteobacteria bacterium]|nr:PhnD/SsuA/transferrin family substrate-binding protein [Deltaproteobacteria bacterium]
MKNIACILCLFMLTTACDSDNAGYTVIDFHKTLKTDTIKTTTPDPKTLRVAVGAMVSPKETMASYQALLNYIGRHLGFAIQLIQRDTYAEINEIIASGQVDIAFICTGPYAAGKEKYGFEGLVTPVINGKPFYQA